MKPAIEKKAEFDKYHYKSSKRQLSPKHLSPRQEQSTVKKSVDMKLGILDESKENTNS